MSKEQDQILAKHKERLLEAMHVVFGRFTPQEIGMKLEDLFEMFQELIDAAIRDNKEATPEYFTIYDRFTDGLIFELGQTADRGMPTETAKKIMKLVKWHEAEAMDQRGLEGKVEAKRSIRQQIPELHIPESFRNRK